MAPPARKIFIKKGGNGGSIRDFLLVMPFTVGGSRVYVTRSRGVNNVALLAGIVIAGNPMLMAFL